jgi:hypothetical protein
MRSLASFGVSSLEEIYLQMIDKLDSYTYPSVPVVVSGHTRQLYLFEHVPK